MCVCVCKRRVGYVPRVRRRFLTEVMSDAAAAAAAAAASSSSSSSSHSLSCVSAPFGGVTSTSSFAKEVCSGLLVAATGDASVGEASGDGSPGDGDMDADRRLEEIRVGDAAGLLLLLLLCVVVAVMTDFSDKIADFTSRGECG